MAHSPEDDESFVTATMAWLNDELARRAHPNKESSYGLRPTANRDACVIMEYPPESNPRIVRVLEFPWPLNDQFVVYIAKMLLDNRPHFDPTKE